MLVYIHKGCLPWSDVDNKLQTFELKRALQPQDICEGLEGEFAELLSYARRRESKVPDYAFLRKRFRGLFYRKGFKFRFEFDWTRVVYDKLNGAEI